MPMEINIMYRYAALLEICSRIKTSDKEEHMINQRIQNNAFSMLLKLGCSYEISSEFEKEHFVIYIDEQKYMCPVNTIRNILRSSYKQILIRQKETDKEVAVEKAEPKMIVLPKVIASDGIEIPALEQSLYKDTEADSQKKDEILPVLRRREQPLPVDTGKIPPEIARIISADSGEMRTEGDEQKPDVSATEEDHSGTLFFHNHEVILKKKFGAEQTGVYRFIVFPTYIVEMNPGKRFAEILVHVNDPAGKEYISATKKGVNELIFQIDGKQFHVYGIWQSGVFDSYVSISGRTSSVYDLMEQTTKSEPPEAGRDSFLDQFRLQKRGQPNYFVVPFSEQNTHQEEYIPIVGYVQVGAEKYMLHRNVANSLKFKIGDEEKVIVGKWLAGTFDFHIYDRTDLF